MIFQYVPSHDVEALWMHCKPLLDKSFEDGFHIDCIDDYLEPAIKGDMQLWIAHDGDLRGCVITSVHEGSRKKALSILSLGGEKLPDWVDDMNRELTLFAKNNNCDAIESVTRPGFSRFVPEFKEQSRRYVKVIE